MRKRNVPGGAAGPQTRLGALRASGWVRLPFSSASALCSISALIATSWVLYYTSPTDKRREFGLDSATQRGIFRVKLRKSRLTSNALSM